MKIALIDCMNLIFRCHHAAITFQSDPKENYIVESFFTTIFSYLREYPVDRVYLCLEGRGSKESRKEVLEDYKVNRNPTPEAIKIQTPIIKQICQDLGWIVMEKEGFEADDVIYSLSLHFKDHIQYIISNDKDLQTLITDKVKVLTKQKGKNVLLDESKALSKWGFPARRIKDYLVLMGDRADDIPSVLKGTRIGEKTVKKWFQQGLELEEIDKLKPLAEQIELNKSLVYLKEVRLEESELESPKKKSDKELFKCWKDLDIHPLIHRYKNMIQKTKRPEDGFAFPTSFQIFKD